MLTEIGVKDSKKLTFEKRRDLSKIIKKECVSYKIVAVEPSEIDERVDKRITLNELEVIKMAHILNELKPEAVFIDAADVDEERFAKRIKNLLNYVPSRLTARHKADDIYPIVGAASILAKDKRDQIIEELKDKYGEIGSGYPSDEKTIKFLRDFLKTHKKVPKCVRITWKTAKKLIDLELHNRKITEFFK